MKLVRLPEFRYNAVGTADEIYINPDHIVLMKESTQQQYEGMEAVTFTEVTLRDGLSVRVGLSLIETACRIEAFTNPDFTKPKTESAVNIGV